MGLYDRDYGRDGYSSSQPGFHFGGARTWTTNLVLFTAAVYVLQVLTQVDPTNSGWFTKALSLHANVAQHPWRFFELISYGFLHDPNDLKHILFNMYGLWLFGRSVESRYGQREYLVFYLAAIAVAGIVWCVAEYFANGVQLPIALLGASGGLSAVVVLFALNFPRQTVYVFGLYPVPMWAVAIFFVGSDIFGAIGRVGNVAYTAHLGGALFAYLYFRSQWKLARWLPTNWSLPRLRRGTKLRLHDPTNRESVTDELVDQILRKIKEHGKDSLTRRERRILEEASHKYQRRQE